MSIVLTTDQIDEIAARILASMQRQVAEQSRAPFVTFEDAAWSALFSAWWSRFGDGSIRLADLMRLADSISGLPISGTTKRGRETSLGMQLRRFIGVNMDGLTISISPRSERGFCLYRLLPDTA